MTLPATAAAPLEGSPSPLEIAWIFARHLLSLWFPGLALAFLLTAPHSWYVAPLFLVPIVVAWVLDTREGLVETRQPLEALPAWPFDALVYLLAAIQVANVALIGPVFAEVGFLSLDFPLAIVIIGASSGYSIITAHELIHRRNVWEQRLGRVLLGTVLYEHFYTEHLRGHHVRVGTPDDPATARFGEGFQAFYLRTVPAQFKSAWRLEKKRLGDEAMSDFDPRMLRHRCLHGLVLEFGALFLVGWLFGAAAFVVYLLQGMIASRLLEVVNYFEHWGLERQSTRVRPTDSWDTHSWFTYYALIGLSRHADHHAFAARPYQQLRVWDEPPMLPHGYVGMIPLCVIDNAEFQALAGAELERKRLGPFREAASASASETVGATGA